LGLNFGLKKGVTYTHRYGSLVS